MVGLGGYARARGGFVQRALCVLDPTTCFRLGSLFAGDRRCWIAIYERGAGTIMTRIQDQLTLTVPLAAAMHVCRAAAPAAKMKIKAEGTDWVRLTRSVNLIRNPADYELHFDESTPGSTEVTIYAHMIGFGPIMKRQVDNDLQALKQSIAAQSS
jgi:hypothetical protein